VPRRSLGVGLSLRIFWVFSRTRLSYSTTVVYPRSFEYTPSSLEDDGVFVYYTYVLRSIPDPDRYYVGSAASVEERVSRHNRGGHKYTSKDRPWKLHAYFAFESVDVARRFERYLKSGSGRAFAKRHLDCGF
jgi:putative endonuclease